MFDSILLRRNGGLSGSLDCGQMIENMFFYDRTIVHLGRQDIPALFDLADVDVVEELLKKPSLSVFLNNSHTGVAYQGDVYSVDSYGLADLDLERFLYEEAFRHSGNEAKSRRFSRKISRLIQPYELPRDFNRTLIEQLLDDDFRQKVLTATIDRYLPYRSFSIQDVRYELEFLNHQNFKIHSNLGELQPAGIELNSPILALINTCEDVHVMSQYRSEISLPEFNAKLVRLKADSIIARTAKSAREIDVFNHFVFDESWALREAINSKRIHVRAVLDVLRKADKYKSWLKNLPDDANLIREYQEKVEERSILEKIGFRAARFYFFGGLGAILSYVNPDIGIPLGIGLNAFDNFLLGRMAEDWKPSQFIEGELRPLVV